MASQVGSGDERGAEERGRTGEVEAARTAAPSRDNDADKHSDEDSDDLDVDHLIADLDKRKKTVVKAGEPAWRRLERIREERQTAEQLSDFDDYEIDETDGEMKPKRNK